MFPQYRICDCMARREIHVHCHLCGYSNKAVVDATIAPEISQHDIVCEKCGDMTHILATICPQCQQGLHYFLTDLDFKTELYGLAKTYVDILAAVKDNVEEIVDEFDVVLPERWKVSLRCACGNEYEAEIPLPR